MSELRHEYAEIEGTRLHWAELGETRDRVPLVLLHGLADSHLSWQSVAEELAVDRRVLMPDLPGCGLSSRPNASYELQWHAHVIATWLQRCGLESVDMVGHSFGGGVAQMLLLECPERMRRIVLVAAGGLGRDVGFWLKLATFPHFVEHYGQPFMAFGTRRALGHPSGRDKQDVSAQSAMNATQGTARAFSRTVRDVIGFRGQTRMFLQRASEVSVFPPIAVFWGDRDALIPIAHARAFVARMEGARFEPFAGCGHYLHQERPAEFVAALRAFLDDPTAQPVRLRADVTAPAPAVERSRWTLPALARRVRQRVSRA